mmetsp:Transcript_145066/g.263872  ORF Transcript_145066/g.263872 Transcript_145066/m.263872 type:complete len:113 (-) Transcript_145066:265-603(-)
MPLYRGTSPETMLGIVSCVCIKSFTRSSGAEIVSARAPTKPPAQKLNKKANGKALPTCELKSRTLKLKKKINKSKAMTTMPIELKGCNGTLQVNLLWPSFSLALTDARRCSS